LKNKYILSLLIFVFWILFFDHNNLIDRYVYLKQLRQMERDRRYYIEKIETDSRKLHELKSSKESLEKFAREQYLMKKKNEDIFVIIED
jgi:cell division protein DivIC